MAVLLHPRTSLPLPARVVSPSRPQTLGLWLLTAILLLLLIVGRITNYGPARRPAGMRPASTTRLPRPEFEPRATSSQRAPARTRPKAF